MRIHAKTQKTVRVRRVGALFALELLFVLPMLLLPVLALGEFALMINAETRIEAATRAGARVASRGGSLNDVDDAVFAVLGDRLARCGEVEVKVNRGELIRKGKDHDRDRDRDA